MDDCTPLLVQPQHKAKRNTNNGVKTLISNWQAYHPEKPQISLNSLGEYDFSENGVFITNGDMQQIIKRIHQVIEEDKS
ncbi:hypothetical protein SY85_10725 [Flavisolibacter tropicus]|uniref:Uncharacterized protein n=1 Tax=Flavisolibacter tropicus TaxID=1492898 RepID=A0A172TV96_9BACT|nr:hypothetical protein SY85_10725 [Flavisolibacter tropicus]